MARRQCPECAKDDQIRKISSIISSDTIRKEEVSSSSGDIKGKGTGEVWDFERNPGNLGSYKYAGKIESNSAQSVKMTTFKTTTEQSDLALRLTVRFKLGPAPSLRKPMDFARVGMSFIATLLVLFLLIISVDVWAHKLGPSPLFFGPVVAYAIVFRFVLAPWRRRSPFLRGIEAKKEYEQNLEEYQESKDEWARANACYQTLYYCYRDDVVFDPEQSDRVIPASREAIAEYCWERATK